MSRHAPPLRPLDSALPLLVTVRVVPRAHHDDVIREGDAIQVRVTAPPVAGAANESLIALLARRLSLPKRAIAIVQGASSRKKVIALQGITSEDLWRRLES